MPLAVGIVALPTSANRHSLTLCPHTTGGRRNYPSVPSSESGYRTGAGAASGPAGCTARPQKVVAATVDFVDIAVWWWRQPGDGLGNQSGIAK